INMIRKRRSPMLVREGRDISNAKRRVRSPLAPLISLSSRLTRATRIILRIVGGKSSAFRSCPAAEPIKIIHFLKNSATMHFYFQFKLSQN
uniref:Uncharacterized protein n=1 Tax=Podarcis muralis TaxID=64176 RepID=A0A670IZS7_PODMU